MSTAVKAKEALDLTIVAYKRCKSRVTKALASTSVNERSIGNKMQQLSDALSQLNIDHTTWVAKAGLSDQALAEEKYSATWLEAEWDEVDDLQDQVDLVIPQNLPRSLTDAESLALSRSQMIALKSEISTTLTQLLQKTAPSPDGSPFKSDSSCVSAYKDILSGIKLDLEEKFSDLSSKILLLDKANTSAFCKEIEQFRCEHQQNITTLQLRLAEALVVVKDVPSPKSTKSLEMEKSRAPTFSGRTIDYPEFKRGWTAVAGVYWDDANQVEQIKHKVDSKTRRIITRCDTMAKVWSALDKEYAQEEEVILAVLNCIEL